MSPEAERCSDSGSEDRHQSQQDGGEDTGPVGGGGGSTGHVWVLGQQGEADPVGPAEARLYLVLAPPARLALRLTAVFLPDGPGGEPGTVNISHKPPGGLSGQQSAPRAAGLEVIIYNFCWRCTATAVLQSASPALHSPALSPPSQPEEAKH